MNTKTSTFWQPAHGELSPDEFGTELPTPAHQLKSNRRDFVKGLGLGTLATAAACTKAPVQGALPAFSGADAPAAGLTQPYATVCGGCDAGCGVVARVRDGRPIHLDGLATHPIGRGGVCATGHAHLFGLYSSARLRTLSRRGGAGLDWDTAIAELKAALDQTAKNAGQAIVVTGSGVGPLGLKLVRDIQAKRPNVKHAVIDLTDARLLLAAATQSVFGVHALPQYRFEQAKYVLSFGADFLGGWISPVEHAARFHSGGTKRPALTVVESTYSITGGKADERLGKTPADIERLAEQVIVRLAQHRGEGDAPGFAQLGLSKQVSPEADALAQKLLSAGADALVVGDGTERINGLALYANLLLGAVERTISNKDALAIPRGDMGLSGFKAAVSAQSAQAIVVLGGDISSRLSSSEAKLLSAHPALFVLSRTRTDTTDLASHILPASHPLESWADAALGGLNISIRQPVIEPLYATRSDLEVLGLLAEQPESIFVQLQRQYGAVFAGALQRGWAQQLPAPEAIVAKTQNKDKKAPKSSVVVPVSPSSSAVSLSSAQLKAVAYAAVPFQSATLRDGAYRDVQQLIELPDPITKQAFGNAALMAASDAQKEGLTTGDVVRLKQGNESIELPVIVQPGQTPQTIGIALGYGRFGATTVGASAHRIQLGEGLTIERTGATDTIAFSQTHASQEGRALVRRQGEGHVGHTLKHPVDPSLWPTHEYAGHRWALAIDLDRCTGCTACVIACQSENNIPVVGKEEIQRRRDMHWLRIDRYYEGSESNPTLANQPMMCQHCENAPCETVCPALATLHSSEGLNMQVYNRCVGTRYCANNCPPKVRRFNWFNYTQGTEVERLKLNPDVVARTRGVMEKCSMCSHRIESAKATALRAGRALTAAEVTTACSASCPTQAITVGDLNNPASALAKAAHDARAYRIFDEINVGPAVYYLALRSKEGDTAHDAPHAPHGGG